MRSLDLNIINASSCTRKFPRDALYIYKELKNMFPKKKIKIWKQTPIFFPVYDR